MSRSGQIFFSFLAVCAAVVVQSAWAQHWRGMDVLPDIVLTVVLLIGIITGPRRAALQGFVGGYFCGVLAGVSLGSFMVSRLLAGYVIGLVQNVMVRDNPMVAWISVFVGTVLAEAVMFLMNPTFPLSLWLETTLKEAVLNALLSILIYPLLLRLLRGRAPRDSEATGSSMFA
ncbi:MAG: hypothetical protein NZT92_05405 [Abditibacteriales bacterium]|nr:hypothetical protein [Abditibacteriales bacterium]MDW8368222.1 hypothetical protein [Abditibacteriales bacterium]